MFTKLTGSRVKGRSVLTDGRVRTGFWRDGGFVEKRLIGKKQRKGVLLKSINTNGFLTPVC